MRLTTASARIFQMHGVTFHSIARTDTGATQLAAWQAEFSPHTPGVAHRMSHEEIFRVLDGQLSVEVDGVQASLSAGDCIIVAPGAQFRVSNDTSHQAAAWVVTAVGMTASLSDEADPIAPPWAQ